MYAAVSSRLRPVAKRAPLQITLFELVEAIRDVTDNDPEVVAVVEHLLRSGSVRLRCDSRMMVRVLEDAESRRDPSSFEGH